MSEKPELYYVSRWILAGCVLLLYILCTGCSSAPVAPDIGNTRYTLEVLNDEGFTEVYAITKGKLPKSSVKAFTTARDDVYHIYIRDSGEWENQCSEIHEKWHIKQYLWHDFKAHNGCAPSAEKQAAILGGE